MTKMIVILGFATAFAAGLVVERRYHAASSTPTTTRPSRHDGWLTAELNLTPEQQEQLRAIWSQAGEGRRQRGERRAQLAKERDQAIVDLIRPEDKPQYDKVLQDYADETGALEREGRSAFEGAVEKTKQILTPEQRTRYEELLQRHRSERDSRDRHRGDRGSRGTASSRPAECATPSPAK